ncbi:LPXTG cell wall anchor domain-containing protein, partial [Candidatus Dojkabacteria bacterium]|nr:LPXTG cell wall anchor domain-containing protein [Candidatus Dojkabacteria bacterium]
WVEGDFTGPDHVNVFTGKAVDDDGTEATDTDDATVDFSDVAPSIDIEKSVSPSIAVEPGQTFTYILKITNNSLENVKITDLTDTNTLSASCLALIGTTITPGAFKTCSYTVARSVAGTYDNTAYVLVTDNDGSTAFDDDSETVKVIGARINFNQLTATNDINDPHTFTVKVEQNAGDGWVAYSNGLVHFTLVNNTSGASFVGGIDTCTTDINGECDVHINSASPGTVQVHAEITAVVLDLRINRQTNGTLGSSIDATKTYEAGKIIVEKLTTIPDPSHQQFEFDPSWGENFFLINDQSYNSGWLAPDSYSIAELSTPGWELTNTSCISSIGDIETAGNLELDSGETITCTFTNTRDTGSLTVYKVIDEDGDLTTTGDQTIGINWEFDADGAGTDTSNPSSSFTDLLGKVVFPELKTGSYNVMEYFVPGYEIVGATCGDENGSLDGYTMYSVDVNKDANTICTFYNTPNSSIHGYKWNDINQDGSRNDEPLLSDWTINLYKWTGDAFDTEPIKSMDTDDGQEHFGWYWFDHLFPGEYKVCEVQKEGWNQSAPMNEDDNCYIISLPEEFVNNRLVSENYVVGPEYNFGNYVIPATLEITKQNDSPVSGLLTGSTVLYTLRIEAPTDETEGTYLVNNVKVTDILPEGFGYVAGTWTATSSVRGDLKVLNITSQPEYNGSPAIWNLGDMVEGEVVTLTYKASINLVNEPGLYKDLAYVQGDKILSPKDTGDVLGVSYNPGYANTDKLGVNFIGTKVLVVEPIEDGGEVLGASITLPATGADTYITLGALISMILGFVLILFGKKRKIGTLFVALVISLGLFTLLKPIETYAGTQTQVSIRLEQPKTGITDREFEITYVALSIPAQPLTIQCKYSTDENTWVDFDTPKTANSDSCRVNETVITGSGTYYFKVVASTTGGGADSQVVSVDIIGDPLPVTEYSKSKGTCTYTLKFKSTTSKVQIYRSDNQKSFYADDTTLITNPPLSVTPNVLTTYTDSSITDCAKEYFYAIRSVDDYNNVSTLVTDNIVTIVRTPAPVNPTPAPVEVVQEPEGEVAGEEITPDQQEGNGEVKGEEEENIDNEKEDDEKEESNSLKSIWSNYKYFIIAALVVALGSGAYTYVRRKR